MRQSDELLDMSIQVLPSDHQHTLGLPARAPCVEFLRPLASLAPPLDLSARKPIDVVFLQDSPAINA